MHGEEEVMHPMQWNDAIRQYQSDRIEVAVRNRRLNDQRRVPSIA
jgi:hypothetical protein